MKKTIGLVMLVLAMGANVIPHSVAVGAAGDKVVICYRGKTILVAQSGLQSYLDRGAVRGACVVTECQNR